MKFPDIKVRKLYVARSKRYSVKATLKEVGPKIL